MFSIRWIRGDGNEHIWQAANVTFSPYDDKRSVPPSQATVRFDSVDGVECSIDSGRVYVMNDAGKTVATYVMKDDAEYPRGLMSAHAQLAA